MKIETISSKLGEENAYKCNIIYKPKPALADKTHFLMK